MCWEYHGADRISSCFLSTIFALRAVCMVAVANHPKLYIYIYTILVLKLMVLGILHFKKPNFGCFNCWSLPFFMLACKY